MKYYIISRHHLEVETPQIGWWFVFFLVKTAIHHSLLQRMRPPSIMFNVLLQATQGDSET